MTPDERAQTIRAVRDCLRYVQADLMKADLPVVSLHVSLAISEADVVLSEIAAARSEDNPAIPPHRAAGGRGH